MRKSIFLFTLCLTLTILFYFPITSSAEWTKVVKNTNGDTLYVDFGRIRKHGGYVYIWILDDYLKPNKLGYLSSKLYTQVHCPLYRWKVLSWSWYIEPMGGGTGKTDNNPDKEWRYSVPNSVVEYIQKRVCNF